MCFRAEVATEHYSQIWFNTFLCAEKKCVSDGSNDGDDNEDNGYDL